MVSAVLPIYSKHANNIYSGIKKYEYRHKAPQKNIDYVLLYETAPVKKITGIVEVKRIIEDIPNRLWKKTSKYAGIDRQLFDTYYQGRVNAVAYELGEVHKLIFPIQIKRIGLNHAPQSITYISSKEARNILNF